MQRDVFLSVVMPGYNEGPHICENLLAVDAIVKEQVARYEIIFVNDGSGDDTLAEAEKAAARCENLRVLSQPQNLGKGHALKRGTAEAKGDYVLFLDSDLDISPKSIGAFFDIMEEKKADAVIGSKMHPDSKMHYPLMRRIMSFGYYLFLLVLFRLNVRDTQTGMKLFRAEVIKPVMEVILVKRFAYDIEVLSIINQRGHKIADAPIELDFSRSGVFGRMGLGDVFTVFWNTLAVFYRLYILRYYEKELQKRGKE